MVYSRESVVSMTRTVISESEMSMYMLSTKLATLHEYMKRMVANIAHSVRVLTLLRLHTRKRQLRIWGPVDTACHARENN
jgi:hypothetical protein